MKKNQLISLLYLVFFSTWAQITSDKSPKIGLVLSGGGAKGFAHIGVLKVIEEAGVKIDYIAGTSMGAIVGALYASGYSAKKLDSIFSITDFDALIGDKSPRSTQTFYEKENAEKYAFTFPFDNFQFNLPTAITKGQNAYNLLVQLFYHVNHIQDFSQLPIPFFCVATDVEQGEPVYYYKGYLPEIIAASSAFPSLFTPVEVDGKLLIDGGIVDNYPVETLRALGVDIVIGVDVQDKLLARQELKSATDILLQVNNFRTAKKMKKKSENTDIYIQPEIKGFSVIDFKKQTELINIGEKEALKHWDKLITLKDKKGASNLVNESVPSSTLYIKDLRIKGNKYYSQAYIREKLRFPLREKISFKKFQQGISNLSSTNDFQAIRYQLVEEPGGTTLALKVKEKSNKINLKLSVHYDNLYKSAALINLTHKNLLFKNDIISLDMIIGDNLRTDFDYHIDKGTYWNIGLKSKFNRFSQEVTTTFFGSDFQLDKSNRLSELSLNASDLTNQFYLETTIREEFLYQIGIEHKYLRYDTNTLKSENERKTFFENSHYGSIYSFLKLDTYDNIYYPRDGFFFLADLHFYGLSSDFRGDFAPFFNAKAKIGVAFPIFNRLSSNLCFEGGLSFGEGDPNALNFRLGGYGKNFINNMVSFFGYNYLSLIGNSFIKSTLKLNYEFLNKNYLYALFNSANIGKDLFILNEWFKIPSNLGFGFGYGVLSFLGPIELTYTWSPNHSKSFFFVNLGFWF